MSKKFNAEELLPGEASLLSWQFGFEDDDDPFDRALWQAISRAWLSDSETTGAVPSSHLKRLAQAYPDEIAVYLKFKSLDGEKYWLDLLERAGIEDRRKQKSTEIAAKRRQSDKALQQKQT